MINFKIIDFIFPEDDLRLSRNVEWNNLRSAIWVELFTVKACNLGLMSWRKNVVGHWTRWKKT